MTPQEIAQVIWNIKEIIRDDYQDKDVDQVILPFTLLRRLDCVFEGYEEKVQQMIPNFRISKSIMKTSISGVMMKRIHHQR